MRSDGPRCRECLSLGYNAHPGLKGQSEGAKACSSPALHGPWVIVAQPTQTSGRKVKSNHWVGFQAAPGLSFHPEGLRRPKGERGRLGGLGVNKKVCHGFRGKSWVFQAFNCRAHPSLAVRLLTEHRLPSCPGSTQWDPPLKWENTYEIRFWFVRDLWKKKGNNKTIFLSVIWGPLGF